MTLITPEIEILIDKALMEDLFIGDPTSEALISSELIGEAVIVAKADGILAGIEVASAVFVRIDSKLGVSVYITDGSALKTGDIIATVKGSMLSILKAERTALNFAQRLSGIATETNRYVQAISGYNSRITDTRKTTPGLRTLEKYAVRAGGGFNHRRNLGDGILIKDNHIQALRSEGLSLKDIVRKAQSNASHTIKIEVEVESLDDVKEALEAGAEILLLDNMNPEEMSKAVNVVRGRAVTEASGGITLDTVKEVAETGVDLISVGALTHSVRSLDLSLDVITKTG